MKCVGQRRKQIYRPVGAIQVRKLQLTVSQVYIRDKKSLHFKNLLFFRLFCLL